MFLLQLHQLRHDETTGSVAIALTNPGHYALVIATSVRGLGYKLSVVRFELVSPVAIEEVLALVLKLLAKALVLLERAKEAEHLKSQFPVPR